MRRDIERFIDFLNCQGTNWNPEIELDEIELGHRVAMALDNECAFPGGWLLDTLLYQEELKWIQSL